MPGGEESVEPAGMRRLAGLLFQIVYQVAARSFEGGPEAEEDRGEETKKESDRKHGRVGFHIDHDGETHRTEERSHRADERTVAPDAERQSERAARQREKNSLRQELADDAP